MSSLAFSHYVKGIHFLITLCVALTLSGCNHPEPIDEIATYLEDLAAEDRFSGAVLIAHEGQPILQESYGLANRDHQVPNQLDTKFNLGSMNKMFTAIAILQLVQQGKLDVEDTIAEHLPDYPNQQIADRVTIHQLLTHTSGLGDFFNAEFYETPKDRLRELEAYLPLFVDDPLRFEPGAQFSYSNAGFIVLGLIVEQITGQSYFEYVKERIYLPCGMTNTDSYELDQVVQNVAIGYSINLPPGWTLKNNLYFNPVKGSSAGGGYSTVEDLLRFSQCLLNHQLLSPELTQTLLEGKVENPEAGPGTSYAYGFRDRRINGHRLVGHSGGAPGVCANLDILLDLDYTVAVLSNSDDCRPVVTFAREKLLN